MAALLSTSARKFGPRLCMAARNPYVEFCIEQLAPLGQITARAMFGGHCLYCDGIVFALIGDGALYLKANEQNRPAFEERGLKAFKPFPDQPMVMQYFEAPVEIFEDADAMIRWCAPAIAAGKARQATSRPRGKRTRKPL